MPTYRFPFRTFTLIFILLSNLAVSGQSVDDEQYAKSNSLDLYYIPENIRRNIALGRGYDLTDPWYPVIADQSPFLAVIPNQITNNRLITSRLREAFVPKRIPIGTGSNEYKLNYEEKIDERTVAQFFHAELKARGISWGVEASVEYVRNQYDIAQGVRFVLENKSTLPNSIDIRTEWSRPPVTETSTIEDKSRWKLFKQAYGSHYVTSFAYGYRIEILAFANNSVSGSKLKLDAAFKAWMVKGKFDAEISENIKQSSANVVMTIFCQDIKNTQTGSTLPFIARGITDVLNLLDDLKNGTVVITPAPTSISFKSYFASICAKYQRSCKLFETRPMLVDSNAVPRGSIFPWLPRPQNIRVINGETVIVPPIGGWAVCDMRTHQLNPQVPDLSNRFLMGTSVPSQIGEEDGIGTHQHTYSGKTGEGTGLGPRGGGDRYLSEHDHKHDFKGTTDPASNIPPHKKVVYIIKL